MPARTRKPNHDPKTKLLLSARQLINRLILHANGEIEMTATQIQAAKIVIAKAIPDVKEVTNIHEMGNGLLSVLQGINLGHLHERNENAIPETRLQ